MRSSEPIRSSYDARIERLAAVQHGAVARAQLVTAGVPRHAINYRLRVRRLHPIHPGVYRVGPIVPPLQPYSAAVLACGDASWVSHRSAAELWLGAADRITAHVTSFKRQRVEVAVPRDHSVQRVSVRVHRVVIDADETAQLDGIPVTTPARTLLDLSPRLTSRGLEQLMERMRRRELLNDEQVGRLVDRYPSRPGAPRLRALLESESLLDLTRSEAEERLLALVRKARLPPPRANARLAGCEVDLLWTAARLVVEVDGFAYHGSRAAFEADRLRDAALAASGFRVMRVTWRQLENEPEAVIARIAAALAGAVPVGP